MSEAMTQGDGADEEARKLPLDFFEIEVIANKPIPEMFDRDFGNDEDAP